MTAHASEAAVTGVAGMLAAHQYRDVLGDYDVAPFYRHFGCSCGWEQNIAGMSGWRSWTDAHAAHAAHVAAALLASDELAAEFERVRGEGAAEALREAADAVSLALSNEVGGHTSTYSVRKWLRDRAATYGGGS